MPLPMLLIRQHVDDVAHYYAFAACRHLMLLMLMLLKRRYALLFCRAMPLHCHYVDIFCFDVSAICRLLDAAARRARYARLNIMIRHAGCHAAICAEERAALHVDE